MSDLSLGYPDMVSRARRAFTLIELLVVVAVVALLIGLLLPALASARQSALASASASNMRQIGFALHMYMDDFDGYMPRTAHSDVRSSWIYTLSPYLGGERGERQRGGDDAIRGVDRVRICPADPFAGERRSAGSTSYTLEEYVTVPRIDPFFPEASTDYTNRNVILRPSETFTMYQRADPLPGEDVGASDDHTHSRGWFLTDDPSQRWNAFTRDVMPKRFHGSSGEGFSGFSNYLYFDAHVDTIECTEIWAKIERGERFCIPPGTDERKAGE